MLSIISGGRGQDAAYLSKLLLEKNYAVVLLNRRSSSSDFWRLKELEIYDDVIMESVDITDYHGVHNVIKKYKPDEFYHLAAQSFVADSFTNPHNTTMINSIGTLNILEAIKKVSTHTKLYNAATSEMFGKVQEIPQCEDTPFYPRSPYGIAKLYAYWMTVNYRESYDLFACSGILFNHESPLRGEEFVTRKISKSVAMYYKYGIAPLQLGNLSAERDWGHAEDFVNGMYLMLHQEKPKDYVLSTGKKHTVKDFVENCFKVIGVEMKWEGEGISEVGYNKKNNDIIVEVNPEFFRPAEVDLLLGDSSKAQNELEWKMNKSFDDLVEEMVKTDIKRLRNI